jgi:hypothetical protein
MANSNYPCGDKFMTKGEGIFLVKPLIISL